MGVFRQFPYSNFHEMNMDEIIKIVKNMLEEWAQYYAEWDAWMDEINDDWSNYQEVMNEAWQNMQNFINNYFDNLDVQNEINNKITAMVNSGEFATIVEPYIPPRVTAWLTENITQPVGVVIDTSLSVAGACADSKATGDAIANVKSSLRDTQIDCFTEVYATLASSSTASGITFTKIGNGGFTAQGTASSTAYRALLYEANLPFWMIPGKNIQIFVSTTAPTELRFMLGFFDSNNAQIGSWQYISSNRTVTVPSNAVKVTAHLQVPSGTVFDTAQTIYIQIYRLLFELEPYNELISMNDDINDDINDVKSSLRDTQIDCFTEVYAELSTSSTANGITFTKIDNGGFTAEGTATDTAYRALLSEADLPFWMIPGKNIQIFVSTTAPTELRFLLGFFDENNTLIDSWQYISSNKTVTIPSNAVKVTANLEVPSGTEFVTAQTIYIQIYRLLFELEPYNELISMDDDIDQIDKNVSRLEYLSGCIIPDENDFEIGGINFSTEGWEYGPNPKRVRTKEGFSYTLHKGDVIGLTDYSDMSFQAGVLRPDGTYGFTSGVQRSDYTCTSDGEWAIVLKAYPDDVVQTNVNNFLSRLFIRPNDENRMGFKYQLWNKPILTIIDDDTLSVAHVTKFYNACTYKGIVGTFATESKPLETQSGLADLLESYEDDGFQIVYHCYEQSNIYRTDQEYRDIEAVEEDFATGLRKLHSYGFLNTDLWVAPYGAHDAELQALAKKRGMKCLVSIGQSTYESYPVTNGRWYIPRVGLNQRDADGSVPLAQLKTIMDACAENNGWLLVGTHFDTWDTDTGFDRFYEIVDYAVELGFDIKTLGEAYEIWKPAYDRYDLFD